MAVNFVWKAKKRIKIMELMEGLANLTNNFLNHIICMWDDG